MTSLRVFCIVMDMTVEMFCLRCCCYRASTGLATANTHTHTTRCCAHDVLLLDNIAYINHPWQIYCIQVEFNEK